METQQATLTEFLLARIAEDEAPTWTLVPYDCPPDCCAPAGWVGHQCHYCDVSPSYGGTVDAITEIAEEHAEKIHQRSRVLAECEAKRRIVEQAAELIESFGKTGDGVWPDVTRRERSWAWQRLYDLSAVYADHPDYREEWKH